MIMFDQLERDIIRWKERWHLEESYHENAWHIICQIPSCYWIETQVTKTFDCTDPDSKVHGANMKPIWGRQDPGGPHVGPINFPIWEEEQQIIDISETKMQMIQGIIDNSQKILRIFFWILSSHKSETWLNCFCHVLCKVLIVMYMPCCHKSWAWKINVNFKHIEAETKWKPFRRQHFQMHFLEWKCLNTD